MKQGEMKRKQVQYYSYIIGSILFLMFGNMIGNNGIAYLAIGLETIGIITVFLGENVSDVFGKMLRYRRKRNQFQDVKTIKRRITLFQIIIGTLLFGCIFIFADVIALHLFNLPKAALIIRILSPVLLVRMFVSLMIGYFQSFGAHFPAAVSTLLRQILFWILGNLFCAKMLDYGSKVAGLLKNEDYYGLYGAIGLSVAIVLAEVIVMITLVIYYLISNNGIDKKKNPNGLQKSEPLKDTMLNFCYLNFQSSVFDLCKRILVIVPFVIMVDINMKGIFYGKFLAICSIPLFLVAARFQLLFTRLVSVIKNREKRMIRDYVQTGLQYTWCIGIFIATLFAVLASQITVAFFPQDEAITNFFQKGSVLILVLVLFLYLIIVQVAYGKKAECLLIVCITAVADIILTRIMYHKMEQLPEAVLYAAILSMFIGTLLIGFLVIMQHRIKVDIIPVFMLPLICDGVTGVILLLMAKYLAPHIGSLPCIMLSIVLGIVLYLATLGLCRVFSELEIEKIYGKFGHKLLSVIFK